MRKQTNKQLNEEWLNGFVIYTFVTNWELCLIFSMCLKIGLG